MGGPLERGSHEEDMARCPNTDDVLVDEERRAKSETNELHFSQRGGAARGTNSPPRGIPFASSLHHPPPPPFKTKILFLRSHSSSSKVPTDDEGDLRSAAGQRTNAAASS